MPARLAEATFEERATFGLGWRESLRVRRHAPGTGVSFPGAPLWLAGSLSPDHAGIVGAVAHQDVMVGEGTPFHAPRGHWLVAQLYVGDGWGWTLVLAHPRWGGALCYMHMDSVSDALVLGGYVRGGTWLGLSGGVPGKSPGVDSDHSSGAHLHTACDLAVKARYVALYGDRVLIAGLRNWRKDGVVRSGGRSL